MADTPDLWWRKRCVQAALAVIGPDGIQEKYWDNGNHGGRRYAGPWDSSTYRDHYGPDNVVFRAGGFPGGYIENSDYSPNEAAMIARHVAGGKPKSGSGCQYCAYTVGYFLSFVWGNPDPALGGKANKSWPIKNGTGFNPSSGYGWDVAKGNAKYIRYTPACIQSGAVQPYPADFIIYKSKEKGWSDAQQAERQRAIRAGARGAAKEGENGHIEMLTGDIRTVKGKIQVRTVGGNTSNGGELRGSLHAGAGMWAKWMPIDKDSVIGFTRWVGPDPGYTEAHPLWNNLILPPHAGPHGWVMNENAGAKPKK